MCGKREYSTTRFVWKVRGYLLGSTRRYATNACATWSHVLRAPMTCVGPTVRAEASLFRRFHTNVGWLHFSPPH